jgi:hypothetical protein
MKVIFLDHDGVICLSDNWGNRFKKQKDWGNRKLSMSPLSMPVEYRFDNFDGSVITHWVAIDDLNMSLSDVDGKSWGLKNFVLTPVNREGIKQSGIKEKIIKFLS